MRVLMFLCTLMLLPPAFILVHDYHAAKNRPNEPFRMSTIAEIWMEYDRPGFENLKAQYRTTPEEWDTNVRPWLETVVFPFTFIPMAIVYGWTLLSFLLNLPPFDRMNAMDYGSSGPRGAAAGFSRTHANDKKQKKISYTRR